MQEAGIATLRWIRRSRSAPSGCQLDMPLTVHAVHLGLEYARGLVMVGGIRVRRRQRNVGAAGEATGTGVDYRAQGGGVGQRILALLQAARQQPHACRH